jgi:V8-like Glu-specific endopeptidase
MADQVERLTSPIALPDLPLADDAATKPVPDEVRNALDRCLLDIFVDGRRITGDELCEAFRGSSIDLALPEGLSTVLEAKRLSYSSEATVDPKEGRPNRPLWMTLAHRPRLADLPLTPWLRSANGGLVLPLVDEAIFGHDDRRPFVPNAWPWTCVGKLTTFVNGKVSGGGTATLVGARTIATAAHILPGEAWSGGNWSAQFRAAWYCASSLVGAGGICWVTGGHGYSSHEAGNDMVVLRLEQPLGEWIGYFGYRTYDDDWEDDPKWTHVGYPRALGMGDLPFRHGGIAVHDDDNGPDDSLELQHYGDAGDGDSGGPLFGWWPDGPYLVGVMSGNSRTGGFLGIGAYNHNIHAGGRALTRLCAHGRTNWG